MDNRFQVFLTLFFASVLTGYILFVGEDITHQDMSEVQEIDIGENRISVATGCFRIDMAVSNQQVTALENEIRGPESERPLTHEIVGDIVDETGYETERLEIHSIEDGAYHADLIISNIEERRIEVRPSDGLIIAAEQDIPTFIHQDLLQQEAENRCLDGSFEI